MNLEFTTPDWVKHAVFYQIFPDRFASSPAVVKPGNLEAWDAAPTLHGFKGGDLLGVQDRLDYLEDLGINAIYLNPIFQSASNHRYHTHDYYQVDPLLGGNQAFKKLLQAAHQRGIRIILDGVFNHASRGFFQFNHILECGPQSPYIDWFHIEGYPLNAYQGHPRYRTWAGLAPLPQFNHTNPQVQEFIFDVARFWLKQGIDGWRLDVPFEIKDPSFWQAFRTLVKSTNPEAYIVGEIPWEAQPWLHGDQFDAVMNYQFTQACLAFFGGDNINRKLEAGFMGLPPTPVFHAKEFSNRIQALLNLYPPEVASAQFNLLSSHDMPRFISLLNDDKSAYKLAVFFLMTYPGAPSIYYGEEIGLRNGPSRIPEDARYAFPWDETCWDHDLLQFFIDIIQTRHRYPALRTGSFEILHADGGQMVYQRSSGTQRLVVLINHTPQTTRIIFTWPEKLIAPEQLIPLFNNKQAKIEKGQFSTDPIPPYGCVIWGSI